MKKNLVLKIVIASVMGALSIVLEKLSFNVGGSYKITFYGLPLMFTSIMFGPSIGLLAGIVVGFISQLTSQYGLSLTTPLWMLAPILWGFNCGFLFKKITNHKFSIKNFGLIVIITSIFVTIVNSIVIYLDALIFQYTIEQTIITIVIKCAISLCMAIPYSALLYVLCNRLEYLSWTKE